ncbi:MAG: TIGR00159 family protein, partial [Dysgonamonadaceae bacterium]|nr:TIGR00159 family protein [Dysgonamonadaceae bacterium]
MIQFGIKDAIDILLVAFFLYETYLLMRKTGASTIFLGVLAFISIWLLVSKIF